MRKLMAVLTTIAVLVLSACGTDEATNVTATSATLNGHGACQTGLHLYWWYEVRNITETTGPWTAVGPKHRIDCSANTGTQKIDSYTTGLSPGQVYQYRIAYQQDGQGQAVCDAKDSCAPKGSSQEGGLTYDVIMTPGHDSGGVGQDYDVAQGEASVSGDYACNYDMDLIPGMLSTNATIATAVIENCKESMSLKLTCKSDMSVFIYPHTFHFFDTDYGTEEDICAATVAEIVHRHAGEYAGARFDIYLRLDIQGRRWTSSFKKKPNRGNCETELVFVPDYNGYRHRLHCWGYYGKYLPGSS